MSIRIITDWLQTLDRFQPNAAKHKAANERILYVRILMAVKCDTEHAADVVVPGRSRFFPCQTEVPILARRTLVPGAAPKLVATWLHLAVLHAIFPLRL